MTPSEILKAARQKITPPEAWTKRAAARDHLGATVFADDKTAVCWCSIGAVWATAYLCDEAASYLDEVAGGAITLFNDAPERTHAEVLAAFDRAIALAEAGEAA